MKTAEVQMEVCENWRIPPQHLEQYAANISFSKGYSGKIPGPPKEYFIERLSSFWDQPKPEKITAYNIMPYIGNQMVGWGHLSWDDPMPEGDSVGGELYIYLRPEMRRQGLGTEMCCQLLKRLPSEIGMLEIPAPEQDGVNFVQERLGAQIIKQEERKLVNLNKESLLYVRKKAAAYQQLIEERGLEIIFLTDETMDKLIGLQDFVELVEQTHDRSLNQEQLSARVDAYKNVMQRDISRSARYWIYALRSKQTSRWLGYTHTILNAEGNQATAIDLETGFLASYRSKDYYLALKYLLLHKLLDETHTSHWFAYNPGSENYTQQADSELGSKQFAIHTTYHFSKDRRKKFLESWI